LIISYFILVLFIGLYKSNKQTSDDYIISSRKITLPSFIATIVTTWYGGILEIGRFTYENGIVTWVIFGLFYYLAALIYAFIIAPRLYNEKFTTIPEYFENIYGKRAKQISSIIILLITSPAPYIMILTTLLMHIYNINFHIAAFTGIFTSTVYIYIGGFNSIIKTDKIQFIFMFSGFIFMFIYLFTHYGNFNFIINNIPTNHLSFSGNMPTGYILSWSVIALITLIDPNIYQRVYAAKNLKIIKKGFMISILFWFLFDFLAISISLYALAIVDINSSIINPYLYLADNILPKSLNFLFYISLLSIVMSTIDSFSFVSAQILSVNLLSKNINKIKSVQIGLLVTALLSYIIIYKFNEIVNIWYVFGSIGGATILIPFLFILFKRKNQYPLISIIIPLFISLLWIFYEYPFNIDLMYPGFFVSLVLNYFLSAKSVESNSLK